MAVTKDKLTVFARGWVHDELQGSIARHGFDNMVKMILNLPFRHADDFGDASRRKWSDKQEILDALSRRPFICRHASAL